MAYGIVSLIQDARRKQDAQRDKQIEVARINALANRTSANAGAQLDTTRAKLLPGESAANIGQTNAQTDLLRETIKFYGPNAIADIALKNANAEQAKASGVLIGAQGAAQIYRNKKFKLGDPGAQLGDSLGALPEPETTTRPPMRIDRSR